MGTNKPGSSMVTVSIYTAEAEDVVLLVRPMILPVTVPGYKSSAKPPRVSDVKEKSKLSIWAFTDETLPATAKAAMRKRAIPYIYGPPRTRHFANEGERLSL